MLRINSQLQPTMNKILLQQMIAEKWVNVQKHPTADLYIYNYTPATQYDRNWNDITLACRGLILDGNFNIVARPFTKFFNYGEIEGQEIPNENFEVYEKMDGSLGILYWIENQAFIATRGSFTSDQSKAANTLLNTTYAPVLPQLDKTKTYLFEIIYPENRIVINYGDAQMLVLLAVIDTQTGEDLPLENIGFPVVKRYDGLTNFEAMKAMDTDNKEGFIVKFNSGLRLKIKFAEYVRIHRIITQVSTVNIWEYLKEDKVLNEVLDRVPDEFYDWVRKTATDLVAQFHLIEKEAQAEFKVLDSRKEAAEYYKTCKYPAILFKMLDNRPYKHIIWQMIRPVYAKPFMNDI
jgi:T4 RnlA family RNA ligase